MKSHARVVVIGGGVVGVSTLYHLAKKGWSDVVLCERTELTAGSTWHAAGLLPLFNMNYTVGQIHKYSVDLYKGLQEETGQDVSFHVTGNLRLATNKDRMDEYLKYCGTANTIGVPFEMITPSEVKELWPLADIDNLEGALYHPHDGHIAPVDLTNALAKGARARGAEIYRDTEVLEIKQLPDDQWVVTTNKGEITCEHLVLATGNYARQTGQMVGLEIPAIPVEHQYIVTDEVPELNAYRSGGGKELPVLRESDASYYLREERLGWILGPYEFGAPARFKNGVPKTFGKDLFEGDLDRLIPHVEACIKRVPSFESAGIKNIVNGPISYTPDGSPLVGPAWSKRNLWLNEGHSFGVTAAGGSGWQLAEWIVEGEPGIDMFAMDPRRFGEYACKPYVIEKNEETYASVFTVHFANEERPGARPAKTSPIHDKLAQMGAVFGSRYGWERPNWFAPEGYGLDEEQLDLPTNNLLNQFHPPVKNGEKPKERWTFRRPNYFEFVANEHKNVRENVGIIDITSFSKFRVYGPGAEAYLDSIVCRKLPKKQGRVQLAHALTIKGCVRSEFTITRTAEEEFYVVSSGAAERYDDDYLTKWAPRDGSVHIENMTTKWGVLVLAGPNSRKVMQKITDSDLSNEAFPWLSSQDIHLGLAPVRALRVNFVGELGWEIHHPIEYQRHIFEKLLEAGEEFNIGMCGMRAMDSLRIEKSYRSWGQDLNRDYSILEAGLGMFVHMDKGEFTGRDALIKQKADGVPTLFVTIEIDGIKDADPLGNEPLWKGDKLVGRTTSGAYGHSLNKPLTLGYVDSAYAELGSELEIEILGERFPAKVIADSPRDPKNESLRA